MSERNRVAWDRIATTTYGDWVPLDWARRWPSENIWKARKPA